MKLLFFASLTILSFYANTASSICGSDSVWSPKTPRPMDQFITILTKRSIPFVLHVDEKLGRVVEFTPGTLNTASSNDISFAPWYRLVDYAERNNVRLVVAETYYENPRNRELYAPLAVKNWLLISGNELLLKRPSILAWNLLGLKIMQNHKPGTSYFSSAFMAIPDKGEGYIPTWVQAYTAPFFGMAQIEVNSLEEKLNLENYVEITRENLRELQAFIRTFSNGPYEIMGRAESPFNAYSDFFSLLPKELRLNPVKDDSIPWIWLKRPGGYRLAFQTSEDKLHLVINDFLNGMNMHLDLSLTILAELASVLENDFAPATRSKIQDLQRSLHDTFFNHLLR